MEENRVFEYEEGFSLCLRVRERLQDLYEGYLDAMAAEAIRAHLNSCFQCNREYRDLEQTVRLIETLPFVEPIRDFTPAIMTAIRGQSGYSFQAPVVEVETEAVVSQPQSITKAYERQKDHFGFSIFDLGLKNEPVESFTIRERTFGVFALVAVFLGLVFGPLFPAETLAGGYGGMAETMAHAPLLGPILTAISQLFSAAATSVATVFQMLGSVPSPVVSLGGASAAALWFARTTRGREMKAFAGR